MPESEASPVSVAPIESPAPAAPAPAPVEAPVQSAESVQQSNEIYQLRQERDQSREQSARLQGYAALGARYLNEQQGRQAEPPKAAEPDKPWWSSRYQEPQTKAYWSDYLTTDERGQQTFTENTPPEIQREYREHHAAIAKNLREFGKNPYEFFEPAIERARELAIEEARVEIRKEFDSFRNEQRLQSLEREHETWLYQTDDSGYLQTDRNGNKVPSQLGLVAKHYSDLAATPQEHGGLGIPGLEARWQFVMANVRNYVYQHQLYQQQSQFAAQPAAAQVPVEDPAAVRRATMLERGRQQATRSPNRASSPAAPAKKLSFRDDLRETLKADGVGVN